MTHLIFIMFYTMGGKMDTEKKILTDAEIGELEAPYVFDKKIKCVVCDGEFSTKMIKGSKLRRIGADMDLRPRYKDVDTIKYNICSCTNCGYSALFKQFDHLSSRQIAEIKEKVSSHFIPKGDEIKGYYEYDQCIRFYELALECCDAKFGKDGEKGYLYLNLAWLYRGKGELLDQIADPNIQAMAREDIKKKEDQAYAKAYEHLSQAIMNESLPIMGLDQATLEYLLGYMAYHFGKYEVAAKFVSSVLTSSLSSRTAKDKALDLKDIIVAEIKEKKAKEAVAKAAAAKK